MMVVRRGNGPWRKARMPVRCSFGGPHAVALITWLPSGGERGVLVRFMLGRMSEGKVEMELVDLTMVRLSFCVVIGWMRLRLTAGCNACCTT